MDNDAEKIFANLKDDISVYTGLKFRLLKLMAIERTAGIMSVLSHGLILMLFGFFTILFLFIALGFYLGELLGSIALGFLIVGGIYLLLTLCCVWAQERIRLKLMNMTISAFRTNSNHDDNDKENQSPNAPGTVNTGETGTQEAMPGIGSENQR